MTQTETKLGMFKYDSGLTAPILDIAFENGALILTLNATHWSPGITVANRFTLYGRDGSEICQAGDNSPIVIPVEAPVDIRTIEQRIELG